MELGRWRRSSRTRNPEEGALARPFFVFSSVGHRRHYPLGSSRRFETRMQIQRRFLKRPKTSKPP